MKKQAFGNEILVGVRALFGLVTQMVWYMHAEVSGGSATENSPGSLFITMC